MDVPKPRSRVESRVGAVSGKGWVLRKPSLRPCYLTKKTVVFSHNEGLLQVVYVVLEYEKENLYIWRKGFSLIFGFVNSEDLPLRVQI